MIDYYNKLLALHILLFFTENYYFVRSWVKLSSITYNLAFIFLINVFIGIFFIA